MEYSKCIWRKEEPTIQSNPGCGAVSQSVQGLLFNDKCKGKRIIKQNLLRNLIRQFVCLGKNKFNI